jgi:hypothetical protein
MARFSSDGAMKIGGVIWMMVFAFVVGLTIGGLKFVVNFDWNAIGAMATAAAVVAGVQAVRWQVRREAELGAENARADAVHRLQMLWHAAYVCRVDLQEATSGGRIRLVMPEQVVAVMDDLSRRSLLDLPHVGASIAVAAMVANYRVLALSLDDSRLPKIVDGTEQYRWAVVNFTRRAEASWSATLLNFEFAETQLRRVLVEHGADIPARVTVRINEVEYPPLPI